MKNAVEQLKDGEMENTAREERYRKRVKGRDRAREGKRE